jgi:GTP cyclohydrolase I
MNAPESAVGVRHRPTRLRVLRERGIVDVPAAERAVDQLLRALGRDPADPHRPTPPAAWRRPTPSC